MKSNYFLFLLFVFILTGCNHHNKNCIEYIDSLRVNLGDTSLRVAIIKPQISSKIRPYAYVYDKHLIVLNKADSLYAFTLDCFERDNKLEQRLNTTQFKKVFVLNNNLYGVTRGRRLFVYEPSDKKWKEMEEGLPFDNKIPSYEDEKYICYSTCYGEFGGLIFFYNKDTGRITFFRAQCLTTVMKKGDGYYITSSLSHGYGGSSVVEIPNPDSLYVLPEQLYIDNGWKELREHETHELFYNNPIDERFYTYDFEGSEVLIIAGFEFYNCYYFVTSINRDTGKHKRKNIYERNHFTKLRLDSVGNPVKTIQTIEFPGSSPFLFRDDTLDIIDTPSSILEDLSLFHYGRTYNVNGIVIMNFANHPDEDEKDDYTDSNILLNTLIQRDSSLIRINWKTD